MATLILSTNKAEASGDGFHSIIFDWQEPPFPKRQVEIKTTADALEAMEQYKAEALASGKPMAVFMTLKKGDRAPNGFKRETDGHKFYHYVNC